MIELQLPEGAVQRGWLEESVAAGWLTQDVLEVELPSGNFVDVGWYPEHDLSGEFWIRVYRHEWENQLVTPIRTRDLHEVKEQVEKLARRFCDDLFQVQATTDHVISEPITA